MDPPGCTPKNPPPGEAIEGGEAGDEGLPLPVPPIGGLMRFSFCRLLKNKKSKSLSKVHLGRVHNCGLPVAKPDSNHFFFHIEGVCHISDFLGSRLGILVEGPFQCDSHCCLDGGPFLTAPP